MPFHRLLYRSCRWVWIIAFEFEFPAWIRNAYKQPANKLWKREKKMDRLGLIILGLGLRQTITVKVLISSHDDLIPILIYFPDLGPTPGVRQHQPRPKDWSSVAGGWVEAAWRPQRLERLAARGGNGRNGKNGKIWKLWKIMNENTNTQKSDFSES